MKIGGHGLGDYLRLLTPLYAFIAAVWALRLVLFAAGVPHMVLLICSVTVAGAVSILLVVLMIHSRRFGGYTNVVAAAFLIHCWQQFLIVAAIAFTALTNIQNVYSVPEFSVGLDYLHHILGQVTFGIGSGTLSGSAIGILLLWMLRRVAPKEARS
jgi:hypothetical protein